MNSFPMQFKGSQTIKWLLVAKRACNLQGITKIFAFVVNMAVFSKYFRRGKCLLAEFTKEVPLIICVQSGLHFISFPMASFNVLPDSFIIICQLTKFAFMVRLVMLFNILQIIQHYLAISAFKRPCCSRLEVFFIIHVR